MFSSSAQSSGYFSFVHQHPQLTVNPWKHFSDTGFLQRLQHYNNTHVRYDLSKTSNFLLVLKWFPCHSLENYLLLYCRFLARTCLQWEKKCCVWTLFCCKLQKFKLYLFSFLVLGVQIIACIKRKWLDNISVLKVSDANNNNRYCCTLKHCYFNFFKDLFLPFLIDWQ